ncbi:stimulated by retinoic acid gene 6 protein-like, partial [Oculina patagonica]
FSPVNLVDSYENRFAFACAFGATTTKCISILFFGDYGQIFSPDMVAWIERPEVPSYLAIIWKIAAMFVIGIAYYPLFACMATDYKITGSVIGLLYSVLWILFIAAEYIQCPSYTSFVLPGDGLAFEIPVFICLAFLCLRYFLLLAKAIHTRFRPNASPKDEENEWMTFYKYKYVVKLLEPIPKEHRNQAVTASLKGRIKGKLYKWKPEFKYSTRVICTYFISFVGIYELLIVFVILGGVLFRIRESIPENPLVDVREVREWLMIGTVSIFVAVGVTAIYSIILVANMLSWYRGHLLRLQRGERNFLPLQIFKRNPSAITTATLKYSGFQVAYLCWGVTIAVLTLSLVGFVVGQQIILPMVDGSFDSFVWTKLRDLWPAVLISFVFMWIQLLLAKYVFLVDKDTTLALDNRRLFHVCTFFLFFFNIFLGVVSCLKRILIGAVLGVMFLGRTQKSVISRDFELMDPGFNAYVGYLLLEHTHANPVLVTFCQLLIKTFNDRQASENGECSTETNHMVHSNPCCTNHKVSIELDSNLHRSSSRRVRNRWHLLYTLHNNPSLQEHRRPDAFIQKSPFAAFQVMLQKGLVQYNQDVENVEGSGAEDIKL